MKYSIQPVSFKEPLKDFLDVFGNLDFLGFNNLTKFGYKNQNYGYGIINYNYREAFMDLNWNPRVINCQYAKNVEGFFADGCKLFQMSITNRGIGYTFNQANFWNQYISTWYTRDFFKIYKPKGFKNSDNHHDGRDGWRNYKDNIFYPIQSGPNHGLTVTYD